MVDYKLELIDAQGQKLKIDITGENIQIQGTNFDMAVNAMNLKNLAETILIVQKLLSDFKLKEIKLEKIQS